jgi:hypothetical protein
MSTEKQYVVDQTTWIGRVLKKKGDKVMLTKEQAKYVWVTLDPKWTPPVIETEIETPDEGGNDPSTKPPKDTANK